MHRIFLRQWNCVLVIQNWGLFYLLYFKHLLFSYSFAFHSDRNDLKSVQVLKKLIWYHKNIFKTYNEIENEESLSLWPQAHPRTYSGIFRLEYINFFGHCNRTAHRKYNLLKRAKIALNHNSQCKPMLSWREKCLVTKLQSRFKAQTKKSKILS